MVPLVKDNLTEIIQIAKAHHVVEMWLFGSATGKGVDETSFSEQSDVDFLVRYDDIIYDFENFDAADNYFDFVDQLTKLLDRKVDIVNIQSIRRPSFKQYIDQQKQLIYAA